jgi:hypothetical protein
MALLVSLECKYELVEESTVQTESMTPNDDNSSTGQSTVQISGGRLVRKSYNQVLHSG